MKNKGHSVSGSPMHNNLDIIEWFIQIMSMKRKTGKTKAV